MSEAEYFPRLNLGTLWPVHIAYLEVWGIRDTARIVPPLEPGQKEVAIWHATNLHRGEVPVLAIPIGLRRVNPDYLTDWYCGVAESLDVEDETARLGFYSDAAQHRAVTVVKALDLLMNLAPLKQLADTI